ncbi:MAG: Trk system potassium transporter TrkA [Candidatus Krumholzibacteriota bacterium]|nr:Trk system potassium transporter TrkA [Candidatus Krumholzibacteriota bacterium]
MQILIVGGGTVGFELAVQLQRAGHDVALVERDPQRCAEIEEKLDILVVPGHGSSPRTLERAGLPGAHMAIAVTSVDEVNILVCGLAMQYGVETRIARIRSGEFLRRGSHVDLSALGVTRVIDPEHVMTRIIEQIALVPEAVEVFSYHDGQVLIVRHIIKEDMPILGRPLSELLPRATPHQFLAVALRRDGTDRIPVGEDVPRPGDDFTTIFPREALPDYLELLGLAGRKVRKAVVAGNGRTAIQLCEHFSRWVDEVILVDRDAEHGREAAESLDGVEVIHGDPTEQDVLREVNTGKADLFVGAGRETSRNVMSALLAKSEGAGKVIAVSFEPHSNRLFRDIGVDHVVSPRRAMAQEIMDVIHRGRLSVELQLRGMNLESLEIKAGEGSKITRAPLHEVWQPLKQQAIAGAVFRGGHTLIPRGNTVIEPGDDVIVVTQPKMVSRIQSLFREH